MMASAPSLSSTSPTVPTASTGPTGPTASTIWQGASSDMSMSIPAATPGAMSNRLLVYARRRRTLLEWMHPTHLATSPLLSSVAAVRAEMPLDDPRQAALAEAFLNASAMPAAPLADVSVPNANLLMVSITDGLAVCRLRVLLDHAAIFRSWIDKPRRRLLTDWVGKALAQMLLTQPRRWQALFEQLSDGMVLADAASSSSPSTRALIEAPLSETADALAWCGFRLLEHDCGWHPSSPAALLRFALPAASSLSSYSFPWTQPLPAARAATSLSAVLLSQLPDFFPEPSW